MATKKRPAARPTPTPTPPPTRAPAGSIATLGAGETFDELAVRVGADREALFAANRDVLGSNTDRVAAGTSLTVPE